MGVRILSRRLLAGLTVTFLLAGCAASASPTPFLASPTATTMPSAAVATAAPAGSPSPAPTTSGPINYGPVTVVTGTATCPTADPGPSTTDGNGVQHFRGGTFACALTTDDARVSGTDTESWNADGWGTQSDGALVQWGTARLENADGAWDGTFAGVYSPGRGDIIVSWYKGTGGYAGLSYFEQYSGKGPWEIQGQIFPGDPPTP
jgi:hypothetical protein